MASFGFLLLLSFLAFCSAASFAFASNATLPYEEVEALKDIAKTLGKYDWDFSIDPCNKEGAGNWRTPAGPTYGTNVTCDCTYANNSVCHVTYITLIGQNLSGTLPPKLVNLTYLQTVNLAGNYLNGTIPKEWGIFSNLSSIFLQVNRLTGPIPIELANITTLELLDLGFNEFYGNLPPELGNLSKIEGLGLSSNNFTGELPTEFAKLTALKEFYINDNQFSGRIPDYIQNWISLEQMTMVGSGLSGPIPSRIFLPLENLTVLQISDLSGPDSTFPQLNETTSLRRLILRSCNINGTLPDYLINMSSLWILDLSFNKLSGPIPDSSENISSYIYLTGNLLTGPLPEPRSHRAMDLSYNNLTIESQAECRKTKTRNLFASSSTGNNSKPYFCVDTEGCSTTSKLTSILCISPNKLWWTPSFV
ncbi:hypothetical protein L6164_018291 [Bauhinia variegata]|uniref:Uncharacterized protein n=1 Tax=Bauhinia variegata TaxID=167791 RepID=A0ACB9NBG4_BAUVA|nr:hypothetical protein L6164_018291 [Bauhinia variegata]